MNVMINGERRIISQFMFVLRGKDFVCNVLLVCDVVDVVEGDYELLVMEGIWIQFRKISYKVKKGFKNCWWVFVIINCNVVEKL